MLKKIKGWNSSNSLTEKEKLMIVKGIELYYPKSLNHCEVQKFKLCSFAFAPYNDKLIIENVIKLIKFNVNMNLIFEGKQNFSNIKYLEKAKIYRKGFNSRINLYVFKLLELASMKISKDYAFYVEKRALGSIGEFLIKSNTDTMFYKGVQYRNLLKAGFMEKEFQRQGLINKTPCFKLCKLLFDNNIELIFLNDGIHIYQQQ